MSVDNYITLNQLKKTTEALLIKINEDGDTKVSKTSVQAALSQGIKIATIGDIDLYAPDSMNQEQIQQVIQEYLTYNYSSLIEATLTNSNGSYHLDYNYNQLLSLLFGQHVFVIVKTFNFSGYYDNNEFVISSTGSGPILYPSYHLDDGVLSFSSIFGKTQYLLHITSDGEISYQENPVNEKADWEQTNQYDNSYILNKPAIKAGEGQNSIVAGMLENDSTSKTYTLLISGLANATRYTYTTEDTLPVKALLTNYGVAYCESVSTPRYQKILDIDTSNNTIDFLNTYSSANDLTNVSLTIYYKYKNIAAGKNSFAQGQSTIVGADNGHAQGKNTLASGLYSHAEGLYSTASSSAAHAEGMSFASGSRAHSEGYSTHALGMNSHAEGAKTIAKNSEQHVFGSYNIEDPSTESTVSRGTYVQIVGNGTSTARSNARTLDWSGNEILSGKLTVGADPTAAMDVVTKQYFETNVSTLIQTALAEYGDGDTASYGYPSVNGVEF